MYIQEVKNLIKSNNLNRAKMARLAQVSRGTVTKWLQQGQGNGWVNVETATLLRLAQALRVSPDIFLQERELLSRYQIQYLWDALYADMESFVLALVQKRLPAIARLVQVLGFAQSKKVIGKLAVLGFEKYKKFIKPARRRELEILWPLYCV